MAIATKGLNDLEKSIDGVNKEVKETSKSTQAMSGTLDKATGGAVSKFAAFKGAISGVTTGFKSLKVAIIGTGIGALLIAVTSLGQAFTRSEEGQNKFAKILGVIGSVTGNLLDLLADLGENIISVFENPKQSIKDFANLIKDNIVNRFEGLLNLIPNLGKAVEQLFKGNFKEAGKIAADSVGKVVLGVDSVTDSLDNAVESVKIADQRANAEKKARDLIVSRAQAEQDIARLREKAVNKDKFTAEERIKFLEEAGKISEDLAAKETEVAKLRLEAKRTENALTKSNKDDLNEAAQLEASVIQLETQRLNLQKRLSTELLTARNEAKKAAEEEPEVIDKKLLKIQEIQEAYRQKQKDKDAETELEKINLEEERKLAELERLGATEEQKLEIENYYSGLRLDNKIALDKAEVEIDKNTAKAKQENLAKVGNALSSFSEIAGKETAAGKALAIASTLIQTYQSAQSSYASLAGIPVVGPALGVAAAGAAVFAGMKQIQNIKKTKVPKGGGGGGGGGGSASVGAAPTPPSFNVVGATETSVLSDAVAGQTNQPVQAYVVANDVTTAQSLENNIIEGATI
jgi:DNA repair exonuclease SbcCD ATPase subunit